jgi:MFS family permease
MPRGCSLFLSSATIVPTTILAAVGALVSAWLVPRLDAKYIIAIGDICVLISLILLAAMPAKQTYWAQVFPAVIFSAFCPDFIFTAAQIITSNSVKRHQQGAAGSLVGVLLCYGLSTGLGFTGTVEAHTNELGADRVGGYRHVLYLGVGMAGAALVVDLLFVRMPKDKREGWDEDEVAMPGEIQVEEEEDLPTKEDEA